jgi:hypothetical protein
MKKLVKGVLLAAFSVSAMFALPAFAGVKVVNCDKGDSLQAALESGKGSAVAIEIELHGTCEEMITIPRDRVTITGIDEATIFGQVRHFGATQLLLRDLTITGPGRGVAARSGRMRLIGVNLIENDSEGVNASDGAVVRISNSQVANNGGPFGVVAYGSNVSLNSTDVYGHPESGVAAADNSLANIDGGSIIGNGEGVYGNNSVITIRDTWISDNDGMGISLGGARTTLYDVTISGNGDVGLYVNFTGSAAVYGGAIENNGGTGVLADLHAVFSLDGTRVVGNGDNGIELMHDAGAIITGTSHVPENLSGLAAYCDDEESSIQVHDPAQVGLMEGCTDF